MRIFIGAVGFPFLSQEFYSPRTTVKLGQISIDIDGFDLRRFIFLCRAKFSDDGETLVHENVLYSLSFFRKVRSQMQQSRGKLVLQLQLIAI